jgi:hypothetical protein
MQPIHLYVCVMSQSSFRLPYSLLSWQVARELLVTSYSESLHKSAMNLPMQLHPPRWLHFLLGSRNEREPSSLYLRPNLLGICFVSWSYSPASSTPICFERFAPQFVCCYHKSAFGLWIWDIDDPQVSARPRLSNGHTRAFLTRAILPWMDQHILHLILIYAMLVKMRQPGLWVNVETNSHQSSSPA